MNKESRSKLIRPQVTFGTFDNFLATFRMLAQAIMMTGSDLCSSSKSWDSQYNTTAVIYEEFYEQVPHIFFVETCFLDFRSFRKPYS